MDRVNQHNKDTSNISTDASVSPETYRFRVNRVNSLAVGCHPSVNGGGPTSPIFEVDENTITASPDNLPYVTSYPWPPDHNIHNPSSESPKSHSGDTVDLISDSSQVNRDNSSTPGLQATRRYSRHNQGIPTDATMAGQQQPAGRRFSLAGILGRKKSSNLPDLDDFTQTNSTVGIYNKSLHHFTQDRLPGVDNYRNAMSFQAVQRPTIDELHEEFGRRKSVLPSEAVKSNQVKFGWIEGCLVRCLLNIWGVMLFLRLSWMVAHAGIIHSLIIITISTIVTTITTLSMSAVSTNGEIAGGGIYYMISRSLGPEWGGAIGVVFSFANSGMAALNTVGFSESMISLLKTNGLQIIDGGQNDNRIISCVAIVVLQSIIIIGMEWEAKAQMGLLVILLVAMVDFVIGAFLGPQDDLEFVKGYVGLNSSVLIQNLEPGYRYSEGMQQDFFTVFSIFFPAVAGIQAGASISGDLKDPGEAIPKGTLLAIFLTSASYAVFAILAGAGMVREATGNVTDLDSNWSFQNCNGTHCQWGLYNDYQVMELMSIFGPLIYAGCFAATLSSALSCLVSGPKTFQALGKDKVYPYLTKFGIGYGKSDDPYWSYAIGFVVALIFILIADLNAIAPLISNFFMAAYALLNFCAFHASLVKPIGWRPTFKYYNTWVSLIGAILCVVVMFLMSWVTALVSIFCVVTLYAAVIYRKPDLNWGTSAQAQTYSDALSALQSLSGQQEHVKNYHPQILCLTGFPSARPALIDFAYLLTKNNSLLLCGHIVKDRQEPRLRKNLITQGYNWLNDRNVKSFYVMVDNCTFEDGTQTLLQASGLGKLAPNILLMGFKTNWQICPREDLKQYFTTIHEAFDNNMAIGILRIKEGLDCSHLIGSLSTENKNNGELRLNNSKESLGYDNQMEYDSTDPASNNLDGNGVAPGSPHSLKTNFANEKKNPKNIFGRKRNKSADDLTSTGIYHGPDGTEIPKDIVTSMSMFRTKQEKGVIDVWWLYDDGGLTLLLPYIIKTRSNWQSCKLRVFSLSNKKDQMEQELRGMASLLSKFRIDYSDLTVIPDITKRAEGSSRAFFDSLIKDFRGDRDNSDNPDMVIDDSELMSTNIKEKINRHLRLRELLLEHSQNSNLIVMTLPIPRKGTVSAPLYMAWLETLTNGMPPFLLVRGNQQSVLTFYS